MLRLPYRIPQTDWMSQATENYCLTVLESKIKMPSGLGSGETFLSDLQMAAFSYGLSSVLLHSWYLFLFL